MFLIRLNKNKIKIDKIVYLIKRSHIELKKTRRKKQK